MPRILLPALLIAPSAFTAAPEDVEFFEKRIRPVLVSECIECHGAEKQKGGLRLDFRGGWAKGGDSGPVIVPGEPAKSLLLRSIRHEEPDLEMPAKRPKLPETVSADFERWIARGAPDPRDTPPATAETVPWERLLAERKSWWSLQPVAAPPVPAAGAEWSPHAVDRFLFAKMQAAGLAPARDAEPHVVLRRLAFTLTGLPPSPQEVAAFSSAWAESPQRAVETAADRLLASPGFGERWARHWMDLVRYAETHGSEGDPEIPFAWRYRDYLVRAMNGDVPWDALIREHIAGDLLAAPRWNEAEGWNESLLGTAHLRLVEHGFQPVDTRDEQVKTTDSQIDVITKAFQAVTVTCARCHDHKFDAVSQHDYYALAGVLESTRPAMVTIDSPARLAAGLDDLRALKSRIKSVLADAWLAEAARIPARLTGEKALAADVAATQARIAELERDLSALEAAARTRVLAARGQQGRPVAMVAPFERWSFDEADGLSGTLEGDAEIRGGSLVLKGAGHFRTKPLGRKLAAKTLEVWVSPATLDQAGGGVLTVENARGDVFDSIVFAEKEPRRWMAGSDYYKRWKPVGDPPEDAPPGRFVHVAASYRADGTIALYREGAPYGPPRRKGAEPLVEFAPDSRVLLGLRHTPARGNGFFRGEIAEARLYDRALDDAEIAASHKAGAAFVAVTAEDIAAALSPQEKERLAALTAARDAARAKLASIAPGGKDPWSAALEDAAKNPANPLWRWHHEQPPARTAPAGVTALSLPLFFHGPGVENEKPGEFSIAESGDRVLAGLHGGGVFTGALTRKHGGIATTPRFKVETDFISIHAAGSASQCRLIVDGYPLGTNPIFPRAQLNDEAPKWIQLDVKYRKGAWAYLEFATAGDLTRPEKNAERSWFSVDAIVAHDAASPAHPAPDFASLLDAPPGTPPDALAQIIGTAVARAVTAWRDGGITEPQRALLDFLARRELLPATLARLPALAGAVAEYRRIEGEIAVPRRSPGVLEAAAFDAAFLPRGDHLKPGKPVPRGYLGVLGSGRFDAKDSGRLALADAIADARNPLTSRVMVNRIWHWVFGRGIVGTPDDFGKMGEAPTHPELLDHLAAQFAADGWSAKRMIRTLVTSRAFRIAAEPSPAAKERDPANNLLSHFRVQRLDAESLRDTLLALSGRLDPAVGGPPAGAAEPRRSVYLNVRRTALNPFLTTFDAPKPFSTLGRRTATNVPAQSLALMNDPFVADCAAAWAKHTPAADDAAFIRALFLHALSRPPRDEETAAFLAHLATLPAKTRRADAALAVFNLKEFIYVR